MCTGEAPYHEKNSYRVLGILTYTVPKNCIVHKKIAVESGYTSSAEQLISFNELGHVPSKLISNSYRRR